MSMPADDRSAAPRIATGIVTLLAFLSVGFHVTLIFTGLLPNLVVRPLHLALALPWVFVIGARGSLFERASGWLCAAAGIAICLYIALHADALGDQYGYTEGWVQRLGGILILLMVLEMARRAVKLALPSLAVIALLYGLFGQHLPGEFGHPGLPFDSLLGTLTIAEGGLWGPLTGVSVNVVAVFIVLGAVVGAGHGGTGFMNVATRLAGRLKGGAAKVSVLASALFGSISGSASANVASTGAFTIPTMKRLGYPRSLAAAVEAVASSGGQIMPPLMGAGAFVMVELLSTTYDVIVAAAILPAILFFLAVWFGIDWFAARNGLRPMDASEIPDRRAVLTTLPFFAIPFGALLIVLFGTGYTPQYAAGIAIFAATAMLPLNTDGFAGLRVTWERVTSASIDAARQIAMIASIILCAGIIIGVLNMTGLGVKVTSAILSFSGGQLWAALLLTALACLILGMEVPTTAAYVICISVAGPALQELGLPPLTAHLFVFWYALLSTITPPVCGTVFIAAGMADAPWLKVAGHSMRLGIGLYIVPLGIVANPALIALTETPLFALGAFVKLGAGLALMSWGLVNIKTGLRALLAFAAGVAVVFAFGI
ncbi:TRAP transporter fused permease subunit [Nisaea sp.]|uniref:TRAP transporter permease n=1 Tax=Nisaea sp. TaxID=2024842 RepID=UPI0025F8516C|nr:TRAP transporter fused permease subunit [Nisaea sp.]